MGLFKKDKKNMPPIPVPASSPPPLPVPIDANTLPENSPPPGMPRGYQRRPPPVPRAEPPAAAAPPSPVPDSPPLFIKVDKYREVVKNLMEAKSFILNLRDALDALSDVQKEISNGVQVAHKTLDELNENLASLDTFFIRPGRVQGAAAPKPENRGIEEEMIPQKPPVDNYVKDVYGQLERLRTQLKTLK